MNILLFVHSNFHTCHLRLTLKTSEMKENIFSLLKLKWSTRRQASELAREDPIPIRFSLYKSRSFRLTSVENVSG